jgi:hypothetical protein
MRRTLRIFVVATGGVVGLVAVAAGAALALAMRRPVPQELPMPAGLVALDTRRAPRSSRRRTRPRTTPRCSPRSRPRRRGAGAVSPRR